MTGGGFTEQVRQELSLAPVEQDTGAVELGVLLRLAGGLHRRGTPTGSVTSLEVASRSGAMVRRCFALVGQVAGLRPELWVRAPSGVHQATTYGATLQEGAQALAHRVGLLDAAGRPVAGLPDGAMSVPAATLRAALLATGSLSAPGRPVHAEIGVPNPGVGERLASLCRAELGTGTFTPGRRDRVVIKSGDAVSTLLSLTGAPVARERWDDRRQRHHLRNEATRLANADAANLRRTIEAAGDQVAVVERAIERVGWSGLEEDLRTLALARLANPTASLAELGRLCEPPVGKSAVHRRLQRLRALADGSERR